MEQDPNRHKSGLLNDLASYEDHLSFEPYVEAIANFLSDEYTKPPLTLSIDGEWGSGKSSFLKQLGKKLAQKVTPYYSIEFNPWRYSENEALWAAFAIELERKLYQTTPWFKKLGFKYSQIDKKKLASELVIKLIPAIAIFLFASFSPSILKQVKHWSLIEESLKDIALLYALFPVKDSVSKLGKKLNTELIALKLKDYVKHRPDYQSKVPFLDKFHEDIQKLVKGLAGNNRVYVFVDDLDRCSPSQAVELIQSINLLISDELKLFFILAIDSKKIAAGIAHKYTDFLPLTTGKGKEHTETDKLNFGYEYLDKFIQIPFQLPFPKIENIERFLAELVETSGEFIPKREQTTVLPIAAGKMPAFQEFARGPMLPINQMAALFLQHNPRKIKKFFNLFKFHFFLSRQYVDDSALSPPQLAKLLIINYRWPEVLEICRKRTDFMSELCHYEKMRHLPPEVIFDDASADTVQSLSSSLLSFVNNLELTRLLHYSTIYGDIENNHNDSFFSERDWRMSALDLSNYFSITPSYSTSTTSSIEKHIESPSQQLICDHCEKEIPRNDLGIYWKDNGRVITGLKILHSTNCGDTARHYPSSSGSGLIANWSAKKDHKYFVSQSFESEFEKERVLEILVSFILSKETLLNPSPKAFAFEDYDGSDEAIPEL